jgi:hypothetical protein
LADGVSSFAPKCHDALAGDHFEPSFFVSCSDVAAINSHRYRPVGQSLLFPALLRTIEQAQLFFAQLLL